MGGSVRKAQLIDEHRIELYWEKSVIHAEKTANFRVTYNGNDCELHDWNDTEEWDKGTVYEENCRRTTIYMEQPVDINCPDQLKVYVSDDVKDRNGAGLETNCIDHIDYNPFYKKYGKTKTGITIKSSGLVSDKAYETATVIVDRMLKKIPEVVKVLKQYHAEIAIYAPTETAYDIPEHRIGSMIMKRPVEGFGGVADDPVTSISEVNVLRILEGEHITRYPNEMILVHEFAHAIHLIGINYMEDKTLALEIKKAYEDAKAEGKWPNTYAISNYEEYFATLTTIWFNVMAESADGSWDGTRGPVNNRDELKRYDPQIYKIMKKIYSEDSFPPPWDETPNHYDINGTSIWEDTQMDEKECLDMINKDVQTLYIGNLNTVEFDLNLPEKGVYGSTIKWKSGNDRIISDNGIVKRPGYGKGSRTIPLYAVYSCGQVEITKTYQVRVLEEENKIKISEIYPISLKVQKDTEFYMPCAAVLKTEDGKIISHAVTWEGSSKRSFQNIGIEKVYGVIKDTAIPVIAEVEVVEKLEKEIIEKEPVVLSFMADEVSLTGNSSFKKAQDRNYEFLLTVNDDQMLYNFRKAAGLDTRNAPEMIGWDTPDSLLRGHTTGHYLSALALCYAATGSEKIREKAEYMIQSLKECQVRFSSLEGFHKGFLSGYSEEQFDLLEEYTPYPQIWAPYYTLHKIFSGLLDCYKYININRALTIADELGDWVYNRLSRLPHDQLNTMWALYIAGEFGGMNDVLARLYKLTQKKNHLKAAYLFDNDKLFYPMEHEIDALDTMHANQHIPQIIGAMKLFEVTGEKKYYTIAKYFWNIVTNDHIYSIGGTGEGEMFHAPKKIAELLSKHTAESCASYNMLKLTHELFQYEPMSFYMDYYERTMINHILSSGEQKPTGASTYFMPLAPGFGKEFDEENSCCHGTGLENHFKYANDIYCKDKDSIYINLFIESQVEWKEKNSILTLHADENNPEDIYIDMQADEEFSVKIRRPYWCKGKPCMTINGNEYTDYQEKDGYLVILKTWVAGDIIHIHFECGIRIESSPDNRNIVSVFYGPYVLAALTDQKEFIHLDSGHQEGQELFEKHPDGLCFKRKGSNIEFIPLYQIEYQKYQVYVLK